MKKNLTYLYIIQLKEENYERLSSIFYFIITLSTNDNIVNSTNILRKNLFIMFLFRFFYYFHYFCLI